MKNYITILILTITNLGFSQNQINENYDCPTSSYKSSEQFMYYYESSNLDSAQHILNDWIQKCGYREVNLRAQTLLALSQGSEIIVDENYFYTLVEFIQRDSINEILKKHYYEYNRPYYGYIPIDEAYDKFTKQEFQKFEINNSKEIELIRQVYSGNYSEFFEKLNSTELNQSKLQKSYNDYINKNIDLTEGHWSMLTGIWIPLKNTTLGTHPEIGFQVGAKKKKWNYDLTILFRFLKSKNEYQALRKQTNQFETTDQFLGGYMGIEVGYDLLSKKSNEFQIATGLGFDGFDALKQSGELNAVSVFSYNLNIGVKYRKYLNPNSYLGIGLKYNFVDYEIGNKISFNEYPIAVNFIYGFVGNKIKSQNLSYINYELRK